MRVQQVSAPRLFPRLVICGLLLLVGFGLKFGYESVQGPLEGRLATKQLSSDPAESALGRFVSQRDVPGMIIGVFGLAACLPLALYVRKYYKYKNLPQA